MSVSPNPDVVAALGGRFSALDAGFLSNAGVELNRQSAGLSRFAARLRRVDQRIFIRKAS
jgi:hypothetical protein